MVLIDIYYLLAVLCAGPLKEYGIRDGDMLLLQRVQGERGQPMAGRQLSSSVPSQSSSGNYHHCCIALHFSLGHPVLRTCQVGSVCIPDAMLYLLETRFTLFL